MKIDSLFREESEKSSFKFDGEVAQVFDNMALRSIPGYKSQQLFISEIVRTVLKKRTHMQSLILDLGCSTGETLSNISKYVESNTKDFKTEQVTLYGTDYSQEMLDIAKEKLNPHHKFWKDIILNHLDLRDPQQFWHKLKKEYGSAQVIILHFVLQFLPLNKREQTLQEAWQILDEGGYLLIGEKLKSNNPNIQKLWESLQYNFKKLNAYSDTQIRSKQNALEGILIPQDQEDFKHTLNQLPNSAIYQYYMHGEFQCFVAKKQL